MFLFWYWVSRITRYNRYSLFRSWCMTLTCLSFNRKSSFGFGIRNLVLTFCWCSMTLFVYIGLLLGFIKCFTYIMPYISEEFINARFHYKLTDILKTNFSYFFKIYLFILDIHRTYLPYDLSSYVFILDILVGSPELYNYLFSIPSKDLQFRVLMFLFHNSFTMYILIESAHFSCHPLIIVTSTLIWTYAVFNYQFFVIEKDSFWSKLRETREQILKNGVKFLFSFLLFLLIICLVRSTLKYFFDCGGFLDCYLLIICSRVPAIFIINITCLICGESVCFNKTSVLKACNNTLYAIKLQDFFLIFIFYSSGYTIKYKILPLLNLETRFNTLATMMKEFLKNFFDSVLVSIKPGVIYCDSGNSMIQPGDCVINPVDVVELPKAQRITRNKWQYSRNLEYDNSNSRNRHRATQHLKTMGYTLNENDRSPSIFLGNKKIPFIKPTFIDITYFAPLDSVENPNKVILSTSPARPNCFNCLWASPYFYDKVEFTHSGSPSGSREEPPKFKGYLRDTTHGPREIHEGNNVRYRYFTMFYQMDADVILLSKGKFLEYVDGPDGRPYAKVYKTNHFFKDCRPINPQE